MWAIFISEIACYESDANMYNDNRLYSTNQQGQKWQLFLLTSGLV
jgi:hypothetical protein